MALFSHDLKHLAGLWANGVPVKNILMQTNPKVSKLLHERFEMVDIGLGRFAMLV
jgi:hypothetical protein